MISATLDFYKKIEKEDIFDNETFNLLGQKLKINRFKSTWVIFENCTFNCDLLEFKNIKVEELTLEFKNCTFNCDISFYDSNFYCLSFKNTKHLKSINIGGGLSDLTLNVFNFSNDSEIKKIELNTDFNIRKTNINVILFQKINHVKGKFLFLGNTIGKLDDNASSFENSTISNVLIGTNSFHNFTSFKRVNFKITKEHLKPSGSAYEFPGFYRNSFAKVVFSESSFLSIFQFYNCDFLSTIWFEKCKNLYNTEVKFVACEFKGFSLFNKSNFNILDIDRCTFDKASSFTDAEFNTLKLFEVKFGGGAYFDEMKINKVLDKSYLNDTGEKILEWKRTLRAIKQELQKTENKIDFNRFRGYELAAHYKELNWNWKSGFKDKSILWATKWSTDFGNSWRRALAFTLLLGLLFYSIFYFIEFYASGNYKYYLGQDYLGMFWNGYVRFLLVTDFYNPIIEDRTYIQNFWSWIPFILGKIVIAFGIYEMIQSFRKFKA